MSLTLGGRRIAGPLLLQSGLDLLVMIGVAVVLLGGAGVVIWRASGVSTRGDSGGAQAAESQSAPPEPDRQIDQPTADVEERTDEDRVVELLRENDGRMKQTHIVDETNWSKSKVSMLLSDMEEHGEISKLRVGRENIISLSGSEPDAAGSPFDED